MDTIDTHKGKENKQMHSKKPVEQQVKLDDKQPSRSYGGLRVRSMGAESYDIWSIY